MTTPPVPSLEHAFDVTVELGPLEDHGDTSAGHRRVVPITGGTVTGALAGEILPGGADWQVVRRDGTVDVDARYTLATVDHGLALFHARGVRSGPAEVLESLLAGDPVDPGAYTFRTVVTVEAAHPDLAWVQRTLFLAAATRLADRVVYSAYAVG